MLDIRVEKNGKQLCMILEGRLDVETSHELENRIKSEISDIETLILDFSGLVYVSSSGLRVLLSAQKSMSSHGKMILKNVREEIMEIFSLTGFTEILNIE